jgi:hypothetical protein
MPTGAEPYLSDPVPYTVSSRRMSLLLQSAVCSHLYQVDTLARPKDDPSPAVTSPDIDHKRKATLSGSIRKVLQNVSSPNLVLQCMIAIAER